MQTIKRFGDIFTTTADAIVHACNSSGAMGAGLAKTVKENYPRGYQLYNTFCKTQQNPNGKCLVTQPETLTPLLANLICGTIKDGVNYNHLRISLESLKKQANVDSVLAFPDLMGAQLFRGDPVIIHKIIENTFKNTDVTIEYWVYQKGDSHENNNS